MTTEPIHSGHFMRSKVHQEKAEDDSEDSDVEVDVCSPDITVSESESDTNNITTALTNITNPKPPSLNVSRQNSKKDDDEKPVTFYKFGPKQSRSIAIDVSLGQLNKCITYAYKKLTTPKWKNFAGLKLGWKQRIRLNNVIWRSWFLDFRHRSKFKSRFCFFSVPEEADHNCMQGVVVEGMYWKRRLEAVCAQYKRWRTLRSRSKSGFKKNRSRERVNSQSYEERDAVFVPRPMSSKSTAPPEFYVDDLDNVFTDRLFDSLTEPYMFPNPKEMAQAGNADFIQPSLLPFQPNLEEIMLSLDNPMSGNDPYLSSFQQERFLSPSFSSSFRRSESTLNLLTGPNTPRPPRPTAVDKYTSTDYAAASLLIEYSGHQTIDQSALDRSASSDEPAEVVSHQAQRTCASMLTEAMSPVYSQASLDSPIDSPYLPQLITLSPLKIPIVVSTPPESSWLSPPSTWNPGINTSAMSGGTDVIRYVSKGALKSYSEQTDEPPRKRLKKTPVAKKPAVKGGKKLSQLEEQLISTDVTVSIENEPQTNTPVPSSVLHVPPVHGLPSHFFSNSAISTSQPVFIVHPSRSNVVNPVPILGGFTSYPSLVQPLPSNHVTVPSVFNPAFVKQETAIAPSISQIPMVPYNSYTSSASTSQGINLPAKQERAAADSTIPVEDRKRMLHLYAEQSRRTALKDGFAQLIEILPNLYSGGTKPTNAVVLAKGGEFIRQLKGEREVRAIELERMQEEIKRLNDKISVLQTTLPSVSNTMGSEQEETLLKQQMTRHVKERTEKNWKYWMLSQLMETLFETFLKEVVGENQEEIQISARDWAAKYFQLLKMRPVASNMLVKLATNSPVLTDPKNLNKFILTQVKKS